jgi:hypothetical protein
MLEWKTTILTLLISLIGILDRLNFANNWNW